MKINKLFLITLILFGFPAEKVAAEGGGPPGQTPTQFGPTMGCAPGGNDHTTSQATNPKIIWESRWGSIAQNEKTGPVIVGISTDQKSKRKAKKAAIEDCEARGGRNCRADFTYKDQCAAIVAGEKSYHLTSARLLKDSIEMGKNYCHQSGNKNVTSDTPIALKLFASNKN